MRPIDVDVSEAIELLDKMQFFGGQRAGRELWADKPKEVQDADLVAFNRDIELLRKVILSKVENTTIEVNPVQHGKWGAAEIIGYDGIHPVYAVPCSVCGKHTREYMKPFCPNCGAKMRLEEEE